ncbi:hypothetical protein SDRG_12396 [Saprolegnia diclina VS20]|uniref:Uncharacterized protein n=1 Tax=Saprolegnia diclina (strain VS20) TaxID=1156394 RepID=T0Q8P5_SAPDV|nr:hypothetical protein SDRG_12396 [Saprolegnia diclina VS20]EQC29850.1 hypothetical protein SDRG_12396 [Saprolegnia diclina VS20]|eukprot:XP_008616689.1 hypothetical protein SDRG_12396 [Saprolegnia diclina VS20]
MTDAALKATATAALGAALDAYPGKKTLIADASFRALLDVMACGVGGKAFFERQQVSRILLLERPLPRASLLDACVFLLLRPQATNVTLLRELYSAHPSLAMTVAWVPSCSTAVELEMERQGLKHLVSEVDLPLYLLPCEENVWSLCRENDFQTLFVEKDQSLVTEVVKSLLELGLTRATSMQALGAVAESAKILYESVQSKAPPLASAAPFDQCILIDRTEDPITLLVTPLHYEGLLDAVLGMNHGVVTVNGAKHMLSANDEFYASIRDLDFDHLVTSRLPAIAAGLRDDKQLTPATELAKKLGSLVQTKQAVSLHLDLVAAMTQASSDDHKALKRCVEIEQSIMGLGKPKDIDAMIEEGLLRDPPLELSKMLKLLCLHALVLGGPDKKIFDTRQQQLCHTYGHAVLPLLSSLSASLQWLVPRGGHANWKWSKLRKSMDLLKGSAIEDVLQPRDIWGMFPTIGYAPLSVRRVQVASGMHQVSALPLPTGTPKPGPPQRVLVYYLGGVAYAELAAYRFLNRSQTQFEFVVATTSICNTTRLFQGLMASQ